jgi:hypothetical protein
VTLKLAASRTIDVTADAGVSKLPVLGVLFSADASYESKQQDSTEQDITFTIKHQKAGGGALVAVNHPDQGYSELGKLINEAELGILGADHTLQPCLQPAKLSVNVAVDVVRTTAVNGGVSFLLLYSVTGKASSASDNRTQIQVDLSYAKDTPAGLR